jgi:hypothetical protein
MVSPVAYFDCSASSPACLEYLVFKAQKIKIAGKFEIIINVWRTVGGLSVCEVYLWRIASQHFEPRHPFTLKPWIACSRISIPGRVVHSAAAATTAFALDVTEQRDSSPRLDSDR